MYKSSLPFASRPNLFKRLKLSLYLFSFGLLLTLSAHTHAQNVDPSVVARLDDRVVKIDEVDNLVAAQIYALQQQIFSLRKTALDILVDRRLLETEAAKQRISVEQLKTNWLKGPVEVDYAKVDDLYKKNMSAFGQMSVDEAKVKLQLDLESQARLKKYRDAIGDLRLKAKLQVLLDEPRMEVATPVRSALSKGPQNAKILILEFSDFQCPFCREVQTNLKAVVEKYASEVRLEFKNFPLDIHPMASLAARSAYCAGKQESFWPFHDALFETHELTTSSIQEVAVKLKLNRKDFEICVVSPEAQQAIAADVKEAQRLGVVGTPTFIINGRLFQGALTIKDLEIAIQRELGRIQTTNLNLSK